MAAGDLRNVAERDGLTITLHFNKANVLENASTAMVISGGQAADDWTVPTGYVFKPLLLEGESNADLTAGTLTFKVTSNGTAISGGPEPALSDTVQRAQAVARATQCAGVAAGNLVGIKAVADVNYAPNTADLDALLIGLLLPA